MKLSTLLLTSALIAPATIFMGATAPVNAQSLRTETHPLAA